MKNAKRVGGWILGLALSALSGLAVLSVLWPRPSRPWIAAIDGLLSGPLALATFGLSLLFAATVVWAFFRSPRRIPRVPWLLSLAFLAAVSIALASLSALLRG